MKTLTEQEADALWAQCQAEHKRPGPLQLINAYRATQGDAILAERERCAVLADAEHDECIQNSREHSALGNHDYAAQWEKRAWSCAVVASAIRKAAP